MTGRLFSRRAMLITTLAAGLTVLSLPFVSAGDFRYEAGSRHNTSKVWPSNQVRAMQFRLQELDFDPGPIDGIYGPKTAQGIRSFQRSRGLFTDGQISEQLLDELEIH